MTKNPFIVKIWGARGTLASDNKLTVKYGGNTACVEVVCGDEVLLFDAGSGLRSVGDQIMKNNAKGDKKGEERKKLNLFFTHCHYDHISGLPFFAPFFDPKTRVDIWSGHLPGPNKTQTMVESYMSPPFFPVGPEVFSAKLIYHDFEPQDVLRPAKNIVIKTTSLNHHDECVGYRVEYDGRSFCYITDTTHIENKPDENLIEFITGTDLMIYDGTYTDEEFPQFWNFGHSTWEEGVRLAKAAGVKRYCIFHHRPSRNDKALDAIGVACKKQFPRSYVAREGMKIKI